jgi:hypothetical protein
MLFNPFLVRLEPDSAAHPERARHIGEELDRGENAAKTSLQVQGSVHTWSTSESEAANSGVSVGSKVGFCTRITGWVK